MLLTGMERTSEVVLSAEMSSYWRRHSQLCRQLGQPVSRWPVTADPADPLLEFIQLSMQLAKELALQPNLLLQEWCLRHCLFSLAKLSQQPELCPHSRQLCLDHLYQPLFALQHFYQLWAGVHCSRKLCQLQAELNQIFYPPISVRPRS
jgi:hypothetical protein